MSDFKIILGNKNYSSWSLRGWLALKRCGVDFEEEVIPLHGEDDWRARIRAHSPAGRVPILLHEGAAVWDSLAITEYLAERFPKAGLWPAAADRRAEARALAAEMHAGFASLRDAMPMVMHGEVAQPEPSAGLSADIARITEIWEGCRARFAGDGPFLFGPCSAADVFYAPVAQRLAGYDVPLPAASAAYRDALLAMPEIDEWRRAASAEPWVIRFPLRRS